jgi:hypothetical protein
MPLEAMILTDKFWNISKAGCFGVVITESSQILTFSHGHYKYFRICGPVICIT